MYKKEKELKNIDKKFIKFTNLNSMYGDHMELLCRKGFYPYEYIDNDSTLDEIGLPPKSAFYSNLTQKGIADEEYKHCQHVYKHLTCKSFYDYHLAYLRCVVLLLADIFESLENLFKLL